MAAKNEPASILRGGHTEPLEFLQWSPDGTKLFSLASEDPRVQCWCPSTGERETVGEVPADGLRLLSPTGLRCVVAAQRRLALYDVLSGSLLREELLPTRTDQRAFSPDGEWYYGGGWFAESRSIAWNLSSAKPSHTWKEPTRNAVFFPDVEELFVLCDRRTICARLGRWSGSRRSTYPPSTKLWFGTILSNRVNGVGIFSLHRRSARSVDEYRIGRWSLSDASFTWSEPTEAVQMFLPADERFVLEISPRASLALRDTANGRLMATCGSLRGGPFLVGSVTDRTTALAPDGYTLGVGTQDGSICLFDLRLLLER